MPQLRVQPSLFSSMRMRISSGTAMVGWVSFSCRHQHNTPRDTHTRQQHGRASVLYPHAQASNLSAALFKSVSDHMPLLAATPPSPPSHSLTNTPGTPHAPPAGPSCPGVTPCSGAPRPEQHTATDASTSAQSNMSTQCLVVACVSWIKGCRQRHGAYSSAARSCHSIFIPVQASPSPLTCSVADTKKCCCFRRSSLPS